MSRNLSVTQKQDIGLGALALGGAVAAVGTAVGETTTYSTPTAAYKSTTGLDAFVISQSFTPRFSGKLKVRVAGSVLNLKSGTQVAQIVISHGAAPGAADFETSGDPTAPTSASFSVASAWDYIAAPAPFPVGTPVQINVGLVTDGANGYEIGTADVQLSIEEFPS
jgi:hypothetical protein